MEVYSISKCERMWLKKYNVGISIKCCWEEKLDEDKELAFRHGSMKVTENIS